MMEYVLIFQWWQNIWRRRGPPPKRQLEQKILDKFVWIVPTISMIKNRSKKGKS